MPRRWSAISVVGAILASAALAHGDAGRAGDIGEHLYGTASAQVIREAKQVTNYRVDPDSRTTGAEAASTGRILGYRVVGEGVVASSKVLEQVRGFLLAKQNFRAARANEGTIKLCGFSPQIRTSNTESALATNRSATPVAKHFLVGERRGPA